MLIKIKETRDKLSFAFLLSVFSKIGAAITSVLIVMLLSRIFSIAEMALFFMFFQAIRFLTVACSFGLPNVIQKYIGVLVADEKYSLIGKVIKNVIFIFFIATIVLFIVYEFFWSNINSVFYNNSFSLTVSVFIFLVGVLRAVELMQSAYFRSLRDYVIGVMLLGFPRDLIILVVLAYAYFSNQSLTINSLIIIYGVVSLFIVLIGVSRINSKSQVFIVENNKSPYESKKTLQIMIPMYIHALASVIYTTSDLWVIGAYGSEMDIANYGASVRLISLLLFVLSVVNLIIPSIVAGLFAKDKIDEMEAVSRASATVVIIFSLPIMLIYWVLGVELMQIVFGSEYADGAEFLKIVSIGAFVSAFVGSPGVLLQMTGHHIYLTRITMITVAFNLLANLIVVEKFGALGVAYVTSASFILQNVIMSLIAYKNLNIKTYSFLSFKSVKDAILLIKSKGYIS